MEIKIGATNDPRYAYETGRVSVIEAETLSGEYIEKDNIK